MERVLTRQHCAVNRKIIMPLLIKHLLLFLIKFYLVSVQVVLITNLYVLANLYVLDNLSNEMGIID